MDNIFDPSKFRIFVLAGTLREYRQFIDKHNLSPLEYLFLTKACQTRGIHQDNCMLIRVGTWWRKEIYQDPHFLKLEKHLWKRDRLATIETPRTI